MNPLTMLSDAISGRFDGWANMLTGLNTSRDKQAAMAVSATRRLTDTELVHLFREDDLAARIVDALPREGLRQGLRLTVAADSAGDSEEERQDLSKELLRLHMRRLFLEASVWGRLFGGAAIVVLADDGQKPTEPLKETSIRSIRGLQVLDRREISPMRRVMDITSPLFGQPETYTLSPMNGHVPVEVHASRLILFGGELTDRYTRATLDGWEDSVLQRPIEILRSAASNWLGVSHLMTDASQAVYKIKDLVSMFRSGNLAAVKTRMETVEMSRSLLRAILLDADAEDFERKATSFTGMPELLDRTWVRVAAAARMPVTILMGQSPAGLNATGESDHLYWENQVQSWQENVLRPQVEHLVRLLFLSADGPTGGVEPDDWSLEFPPLRQQTETERANVRKTVADADAVYLREQVFLPEEVALARSGPNWSMDTPIDRDLRERILKAERETMLAPEPRALPGAEDDDEPAAPPPGAGEEE